MLFYGQGGMEGGNALADILTGAVGPSGKLTDTWAMQYGDYPGADTFGHRNGDLENEAYSEGIYVGYRWFDKHEIRPQELLPKREVTYRKNPASLSARVIEEVIRGFIGFSCGILIRRQ